MFDFRDFAYFSKGLVQFHCCFVVFNFKWMIFKSCIHKVKMIFTNTGLSFDAICVMITQCNNTWQALVSKVRFFSIDSMLGKVIGLSAERGDFLAIDVSVEPSELSDVACVWLPIRKQDQYSTLGRFSINSSENAIVKMNKLNLMNEFLQIVACQ